MFNCLLTLSKNMPKKSQKFSIKSLSWTPGAAGMKVAVLSARMSRLQTSSLPSKKLTQKIFWMACRKQRGKRLPKRPTTTMRQLFRSGSSNSKTRLWTCSSRTSSPITGPTLTTLATHSLTLCRRVRPRKPSSSPASPPALSGTRCPRPTRLSWYKTMLLSKNKPWKQSVKRATHNKSYTRWLSMVGKNSK